MIIENKYTVKLSETGKDNKVTDKAILSYLEDIGGIHSNKAGYGIFDIPRTHLSWILLEWKLQVIKRPNYTDELKVKTWSKGSNKYYTYRDFEIYDEHENLIIIASSKWVFLDTEKGKVVKIAPEVDEKYEPELNKNVFKEEDSVIFEKIKEPEQYENEVEYTVKRADIDVNNHMHNLNYIELAIEALPEDVYMSQHSENIRISYKKEIKLGETVKCKYACRDGKNVVAIKSQDESILHAIIELY